jgi:glycolate oxidase FAD binding subunit
VRDYVLGATLLNGHGDVLSFGGQVMKNVAGYDVARLLAGSMGILGVILEVSLKVLPLAPATATLHFALGHGSALRMLNGWAARPLPLNASAWQDGTLTVRLRGAHAAVQAAIASLGGELIEPHWAAGFWQGLRDQRNAYFQQAARAEASGAALWRLSVAQTAAPIELPGQQLIEWGGAQRWLVTDAPASAVTAGPHPPRAEEGFRPGRHLQSGPAVPRAVIPSCKPDFPTNSATRPRAGRPMPSCANACTAAFAPRRAPPTKCSATSWMARAGAST